MGKMTAVLRNFISSNNNRKWELSSGSSESDNNFNVLFYANGNCKANEGYVSIIFSKDKENRFLTNFLSYDEIRCHVSVVDVAGNKRFTQSFVVIPNEVNDPTDISQFDVERYLKRETLLNDPAELLPDGCLTISLDFDRYRKTDIPLVASQDTAGSKNTEHFCTNETETFIQLDTDFGRELCRVSKFFRCASDEPMMENRTRKVRIPEEETIPFSIIFDILNGSEKLQFPIKDICELYCVADKYDIQKVIEKCREFVRAFLRARDDANFQEQAVPAFLELAEKYRDDDLKETLKIYLKSKEIFGMNFHALGNHLREKLQSEWNCEFKENGSYAYFSFFMRRRVVIVPS